MARGPSHRPCQASQVWQRPGSSGRTADVVPRERRKRSGEFRLLSPILRACSARGTFAPTGHAPTVLPAHPRRPSTPNTAGPVPSHRSSLTPSRLVGERKEQCFDQRYQPYQRRQGADPPYSLAAEAGGNGRTAAVRLRRSQSHPQRLADHHPLWRTRAPVPGSSVRHPPLLPALRR